jgi:hypothetical protein
VVAIVSLLPLIPWTEFEANFEKLTMMILYRGGEIQISPEMRL